MAHSSSSAKRFVELDFFRGLVLLIIVVDHIGGSILSRGTLHAYALCDAAEVFVFLGGFATASAYLAVSQRHDEVTARRRFMRRAFEIYRAFLVTAALMLLVTGVLALLNVDAPNMAFTDLDDLLDAPLAALADIALFRRQPYLSSVLPMYAFFALSVPLVLPLARRKPWLLLAGSLVIWALAPFAAPWLPTAAETHWDFNPFAWQLMFVLGVIARCQPVHQRVSEHRLGWIVTTLAVCVVLTAAYYKIEVETQALDGVFKRNLAWFRVLNFAAIGWLAANLVRLGWAKKLAQKASWVVTVGRQGMLCFVAGAVISLLVDSLLYQATDGYLDIPRGLIADATAIGLLLAVAQVSIPVTRWFSPRLRPSGSTPG